MHTEFRLPAAFDNGQIAFLTLQSNASGETLVVPLVCMSASSGKPKVSLALPDLNRRVQGRCPYGVAGNRFFVSVPDFPPSPLTADG